MKKIYSLVAILFTMIGFAQVPAGYYNTATGTGAALKTNLRKIIDNVNNGLASEHVSTDNGYNGLYTTYQTSDIDSFYENDGTIMDMYSERPTAADPYNYSPGSTQRCGNYSAEGDCYNREHMIPQSIFDSNAPMVSDAHFITPTDGKVNGVRSNYPHGKVATASITSLNGSKLGSSAVPGYSGTVFEPIDEFKGDIARMYFYFVTRYETTVSGYSYAAFSGNAYPAIDSAFLTMLMSWHTNDPVSAFEIARNNAIYARQNNRNPYIDHPEYVDLVWGATSCPADTQAPTAPTNVTVTNTTSSTITLSWTASTDNIGVTNYDIYVDGVKYASSGGTTSITLNGLNPSTTYSIYVIAKDCKDNLSPASNTTNGTTLANTGGSCSGSITENFEAIPSGGSTYGTYSWTNPTTNVSWTATDSRTDQTINTKSITVRNGSLTSGTISNGIGEITVTTQLKFTGSAGTFTVKVNGVTAGTIPYSATATTTTLSNINTAGNVVISFDSNTTTSNRVAFDDLTWTCYSPMDVNDFTIEEFIIYPNPANDHRINIKTLTALDQIQLVNVNGQIIKQLDHPKANQDVYTLENLPQGFYLLKLSSDNQTIVKKIVIN
ncbi:endonuclease [Flavobacterium humi]|uniref:T9SS type A sorting domain-containing protein n=1 Tax=Flavobacterium humi TaxID=2562683 RepID=A0A4Z0LD65_9FLAO|nr:endonuclease [Flavobacterium humi]TGD59815.1 T9SS type A sorting domain-containing protein [Flavobacterium humi]